MKKMMLGFAALMITAVTFAHDSTKVRKTPEEMANKKADKLKTELSLSDQQRTSVYNLLLDKINKKKAIHAKYEGAKDKQAMKTEMKAVEESFDTGMKGLLSADQYTKWQSFKDKHKKKSKGKRAGPEPAAP